MANLLSLIGFVAVVGVLTWLSHRYEPHWCSKDGTRFTARVRVLQTDDRLRQDARREMERPTSAFGSMFGSAARANNPGVLSYRWREAKAFVDDDRLQLIARQGPVRRPLPPARVLARGDEPVHGRWVYLLDTEPMRELRVPVKSRAVASLDRLLELSSR